MQSYYHLLFVTCKARQTKPGTPLSVGKLDPHTYAAVEFLPNVNKALDGITRTTQNGRGMIGRSEVTMNVLEQCLKEWFPVRNEMEHCFRLSAPACAKQSHTREMETAKAFQGVVAHAYNTSSWEMEAGTSGL